MAWARYVRLLETHPVKIKAVTSSFITGLSDVCLQLYEKKAEEKVSSVLVGKNCPDAATSSNNGCAPSVKLSSPGPPHEKIELDLTRTLTLATVGLIYSGPINHLWFSSLEKIVRTSCRTRAVGLKLMLDQLVFAPIAISGYMVTRGLLEGNSFEPIHARLQSKLVDCTMACWQFWPVANLVSFSVVPVMYRVLFGNMCAIFWNARLSSLSSQKLSANNEVNGVAGERFRATLSYVPLGSADAWIEAELERELRELGDAVDDGDEITDGEDQEQNLERFPGTRRSFWSGFSLRRVIRDCMCQMQEDQLPVRTLGQALEYLLVEVMRLNAIGEVQAV